MLLIFVHNRHRFLDSLLLHVLPLPFARGSVAGATIFVVGLLCNPALLPHCLVFSKVVWVC